MSADHDYKLLFSNPRTVADLLRGFVREDWAVRLDFGTLERVNGDFVSDKGKERRNDVIWRLRFEGDGEEGWFYLYVLLEFQSASDSFMAVRLLSYVGLLLEQVIRTEKLTAADKLPPVLPLVLYNGRRPWRAPLDLAKLFAPVPPDLRRHLPRLEYLLVDESRLTDEEKGQRDNLTAALFRLETCDDPGEFSLVAKELAVLLPPGEEPELRRIITAWILKVLRRTFQGATIPSVDDLEEVPMLEENLIAWRDAAWEDGLQTGRKAGLLEGSRQVVLRLMEKRFGRVPRRVRTRIETISSMDELERLADQLLVAKSFRDLGLA